MARKGQGKPTREVTKRQLSRWQQQKKRQRLLFAVGILIIIAALVTVGAGWYAEVYRPGHQTVIVVNGVSFDMNNYVKVLKYYGRGQSMEYLYSLANEVVRVIKLNELIGQRAEMLGITVSDAEVDEALKRYDPPLSNHRDMVRAKILIAKMRDEYFEQQVPLFAEQVHSLAVFLESESQAAEVRARLEAGEDFVELAGELSLEVITAAKNGDLGWRPQDVLAELLQTSVPGDYAFNSEVGVLSSPIYDEARTKSVGYWLVRVSAWNEGSGEARVQVILVDSEDVARGVKVRLEAGDDFATLAGEFSQHEESKANGGELGWIAPGVISPAVDEFVFESGVGLGTISEPIRDDVVVSTGGYWLVEVLDKDDRREIEDDDRESLKAKALEEWISSLWDDPGNEIEDYLSTEQKLEAIAIVVEG